VLIIYCLDYEKNIFYSFSNIKELEDIFNGFKLFEKINSLFINSLHDESNIKIYKLFIIS